VCLFVVQNTVQYKTFNINCFCVCSCHNRSSMSFDDCVLRIHGDVIYLTVPGSLPVSVNLITHTAYFQHVVVPSTARQDSRITMSASPVLPIVSSAFSAVLPTPVYHRDDRPVGKPIVASIRIPGGRTVHFPKPCTKVWAGASGCGVCTLCENRRTLLTGHTHRLAAPGSYIACTRCDYELFTCSMCKRCSSQPYHK
jgi:hypothetical protein